jgi:serine/threonine protein kinase
MDKYLLSPVFAQTPHSIDLTAVGTSSQKQVALKVLNLPTCDFEQPLIDNEIAIMRRVKSSFLLKALDILELSGRKIIVTPLARGTLADFVRPDHHNLESLVRRVIKQLLHALQFLHSLSIVHRDVKPANIHVTNDDEQNPDIVLADFGYAADLNKEFKHELVGTSTFMAPESYGGKNYMVYKLIDFRSVTFQRLTHRWHTCQSFVGRNCDVQSSYGNVPVLLGE